MAIGTAVRKMPGSQPQTETLPAQAIIRDKDTWFSNDDMFARDMMAEKGGSD